MTEQQGTVLVILSGSHEIDLRSGKSQETGYFLSELYAPVSLLERAGYRPVFSNPSGQTPHMDPLSDHVVWFLSLGEYHRAKMWLKGHLENETEGSLRRPIPFSSWGEADLLPIDAIVVPGGHAPMVDLHNNQNLGYIIHHFHRHNKPTGLICHGPVALLSTNLAIPMDQSWPYAGYRMTAFSNKEEVFNELLWRDRLQFKVEDGLKEAGAFYEARWPLLPHVVHDRELITAQGPTSAWRFGEALVNALQAHHQERARSAASAY
jgi:putative intracellular protease/amidase